MRRPFVLTMLLLVTGCAGGSGVAVAPGDAEEVAAGKADADDSPRVELKVTIDPLDIRRARYRLRLLNESSEERAIWFYDTAGLELFAAGVILRARERADEDDSTVKIRPLGPEDVSGSFLEEDGFKCEVDRLLDRDVPSCSLTVDQEEGEIAEVGAGEREIDRLFSDEQEELLANYGPLVDQDALLPLGPIPARVWRIETDALPEPVTAELWYLPDGTQLLELSMKVDADDADDDFDDFLDWIDDRGLRIAAGEETKTRRALELLAPAGG